MSIKKEQKTSVILNNRKEHTVDKIEKGRYNYRDLFR